MARVLVFRWLAACVPCGDVVSSEELFPLIKQREGMKKLEKTEKMGDIFLL
jgi:hypothetical protein